MKITLRLFLLTLIFLNSIVGCTPKKDEEEVADPISYYDPRIPFGTIADSDSLGVRLLNVVADNSQLDKITLSWTVPPIYKTMDYEVYIYKREDTGGGAFELPDPSDEASGADFYLRGVVVADNFIDVGQEDGGVNTVNDAIQQGSTYDYWLYLKVDDKWSAGVKVTSQAKSPEDTFIFPVASKFWEYLRGSLGYSTTSTQAPTPSINLTTMNYFPELNASIGNPVGGSDFDSVGNIMYYADTTNNRVIIYTRGLAYTCEQFKVSDPQQYLACRYQYDSAPLTAVNILGQESQYERKSCSQYEAVCSQQTNESSCTATSSICQWTTNLSGPGSCSAHQRCLNQPTKVTVADNKLFISDSGNNRVVVYNQLPLKGCDANTMFNNPQPIDCKPDFVIGKKGLIDLTDYPIGPSSLSNPTAVNVKDGNLYIADTNNNRVVMIEDYADSNEFNCEDPSFWEQPLCSFDALLGQKDFYSKWSFKDGSDDGSNTKRHGTSGYDGITCLSGTCESPLISGVLKDEFSDSIIDPIDGVVAYDKIMQRYFRKPIEIKFSEDKILIGSNEEISVTSPLGTAQLQGRVLVWDQNPMIDGPNKCNEDLTLADFDSDLSCRATKAIGQSQPNKLVVVSASGRYSDSSFGIRALGSFDLRNNLMLAVDIIDNLVYQWNDFTDNSLAGTPSNAKVQNPEGQLDNTTGQSRYLPDLQGMSDIKILKENNLIYISDPGASRVHEIRAFEYNLPQ